MTAETTNIFAAWNKPLPASKFYGATLGYFEHRNVNTDEMLIIEAIIDVTHGRFVFIPYRNKEAQSIKYIIDQAQTTPDSCNIVWIRRNGEQSHRINALYNITNDMTHLPNIRLVAIISDLWELCQQYNNIYKDKHFPKLPKDWKLRLKLLEEWCKSAMDWRQ